MGGFGQRRGGPGGITFRPDFLRRDMRLFVDLLELDEDQSSIVEALLLDYETSYTEASEAMRDVFLERRDRYYIVSVFCAPLEMLRRQVVTLESGHHATDLRVHLVESAGDPAA